MHRDRETIDWFLHEFTHRIQPEGPDEWRALLDSPNRVVFEVTPEAKPTSHDQRKIPGNGRGLDSEPPRPQQGGLMPQHVMLVLSNAKDGREAEFNDWYDAHMRDTIDKLDGFAAAQRFELAPLRRGADVPTATSRSTRSRTTGSPARTSSSCTGARSAPRPRRPAARR